MRNVRSDSEDEADKEVREINRSADVKHDDRALQFKFDDLPDRSASEASHSSDGDDADKEVREILTPRTVTTLRGGTRSITNFDRAERK